MKKIITTLLGIGLMGMYSLSSAYLNPKSDFTCDFKPDSLQTKGIELAIANMVQSGQEFNNQDHVAWIRQPSMSVNNRWIGNIVYVSYVDFCESEYHYIPNSQKAKIVAKEILAKNKMLLDPDPDFPGTKCRAYGQSIPGCILFLLQTKQYHPYAQ
ncbi:hypothetical protein [Cysteiniphilum sp. 6C5]|uniref:hypothetical protein n=1 Tax=unclassified Cysteiniphilum TaxID=2610889 RepID=UPI003F84F480